MKKKLSIIIASVIMTFSMLSFIGCSCTATQQDLNPHTGHAYDLPFSIEQYMLQTANQYKTSVNGWIAWGQINHPFSNYYELQANQLAERYNYKFNVNQVAYRNRPRNMPNSLLKTYRLRNMTDAEINEYLRSIIWELGDRTP